MGRKVKVVKDKRTVRIPRKVRVESDTKKNNVDVDGNARFPTPPCNGIPTLMSFKYTKMYDSRPNRQAMPGVTPESAEDSDVEVSNPSLEFMNDNSGNHLYLDYLRDVSESCEHRKRRFMFGNDRMFLTCRTFDKPFKHLMKSWYANPMGEELCNDTRKLKIIRSPTVESDCLYNCTGVYVFCPSKSDTSPPVLRFIRAPVDYSHNGHTAALYGITDPDSMITRTKDWTLQSAWENKGCSHVRFMSNDNSDGLDGDWGAMVHSVLPYDDVPIDPLVEELGAATVLAIADEIMFDDSKVKHLRKGKSCSMKQSMKTKRVLLPRVFPVFSLGDMPSSCDLELRTSDAESNLKRLAAQNCGSCVTFSHSLHLLLTSNIFSMWLSAVLADSEMFSAVVTTFVPLETKIYADCYGAMLVARRLGWDILESCCNNPNRQVWNEVDRYLPSFKKESDRNLLVFEKHHFRGDIF